MKSNEKFNVIRKSGLSTAHQTRAQEQNVACATANQMCIIILVSPTVNYCRHLLRRVVTFFGVQQLGPKVIVNSCGLVSCEPLSTKCVCFCFAAKLAQCDEKNSKVVN